VSAIEAVSRTVKTMADGTLRLTLDISPVHAQDAFILFGAPDVPVALARLTQEAATASAQQETIQEDKGGYLSQWLALRCNEPEFWAFVAAKGYAPITSGLECDATVKLFLQIKSKRELDNNPAAAQQFHTMIRIPYQQWLAGKR
jgi:hypothetical protein